MSFSVNDPWFAQPALDYLNPVTDWTETPDDAEPVEVHVAMIVVGYQPHGHGRVVRCEITASPAYITAAHGRMIDAATVAEIVADGHQVTWSRFEVRGGYLDVCSDLGTDDDTHDARTSP